MNITDEPLNNQPDEQTMDEPLGSQFDEQEERQPAEQEEAPEALEATPQVEPSEIVPEAPAGDEQAEAPEAPEAGRQVSASGEGAVSVGRDVGGDVVTGPSVKLSDVRSDILNIFQTIMTDEKAPDTDKLPLAELKEEWRKVKAVFVPSPGYEDMRKHGFGTHGERVCIVHGPEHAGKLTCAVHLGLDLHEAGQISGHRFSIYKRTAGDTRSLIEFAQDSDLAENTVYIIEDAFENGVDPADLSSSPYLSAINTALELKNAYLILTTTYQVEQLAELQVGKMSAAVEDMHAVFENHLTLYSSDVESGRVPEKLIELVREKHEELEKHFQWPFQIDLFFKRLSRLSTEAEIDELLGLARQVENIAQEPARPWFEKLEDNVKLYAMLTVLFGDIKRLMLDEIYVDAVQILRNKGISNLRDPREMGLNDMLEKIQAQEEAGFVRFSSPAFEQEIRRQIVNHHHLLWSLIDLLLELIETYQAPHYWELRRDLGAALGRLGIYHKYKLDRVLNTLAKYEHGGVVAVAGYTLNEICRTGSEHYTFVTELLDRWIDSGNPSLMWAAGASIWRIYDGLAKMAQVDSGESLEARQATAETLKHVQETFTRLARTFDSFNNEALVQALQVALGESIRSDQIDSIEFSLEVAQRMQSQLETWAAHNARSILHAVRQIAPTNSKDIVEQITNWLRDENSNLCMLGQMAGRQLFYENSDPEIKLLEERHGPLLDLIGPLLSTLSRCSTSGDHAEQEAMERIRNYAKQHVVGTMIRTLLGWLQQSPEWANRIHEALLHVVNRAEKEEATVLCTVLSKHWLDSEAPDAQCIGRALMARSYVMDGSPLHMPEHRYGVILLDASPEARVNQTCARAGRELYERLDTQLDMRVMRMGMIKMLTESGQSISTADLQAEHARPRLLLPPLEELDSSKAYFALALAWGPIIDFEDIFAGSWSERLIVAAAKGKAEWPDRITVIPVKPQISDSDLVAIEEAVSERLARALATLGPEEWWSTLRTEYESADIDAIIARLNGWAEQLDNVEYSRHPGDVARTIVCTSLYLAAGNLPRCVEIVRTWLTEKEEENELSQLIGAACGKALFRIYAQRDPVPPIESHAILLELAPLLAKQWSGVEAVLDAARRWAVQPEWSERLLMRPDGSSSELIQLVDEVMKESPDALADALKGWVKPLDTETEEEEIAPEPVVKLAERLQLHIALGTREPLPELLEGHTYGLIVLDASGNDDRARSRLAKLASNVIKKLNQDRQETLQLLVYRMGQDYPVALPGQTPDAEVLVPPSLNRRPRLLGPLLEAHQIGQVSFVLLLTNGLVLDAEDWRDTPWSERISVYSNARRSPPCAEHFTPIARQSQLEEAESVILRHLARKIGA